MRFSVLILLLCLMMSVGCAGHRNFTIKDENTALKKAGEWKSNRAIMIAAENSGNLGVVLNTGAQELEARPDNAEARIMVARVQSRLGNPQQALETLSPISASNDPAMALEQGRAQLAVGELEAAQISLEQAASVKNRVLAREAKKLQAVACDLEGRHADAQEAYRALLAEQNEATVRYNYGRSLMLSKEDKRAVTVLLPLADRADMPQARLACAAAMARSGDMKGARNLLEGYMPAGDIAHLLGEKK